MKKSIILLTAIIILSSCATTIKYSDRAEYGLKGKVKSMTTTYYDSLIKKDKHWLLDSTKIRYVYKSYFNKDGNIDKTFYRIILGKDTIHYKYTYVYENGKKFKVYHFHGNTCIGVGEYKWLSPYHYQTETLYESVTSKAFSKLNKQFREIEGGYVYKKIDGKVLKGENYKSTVDKNNRLIQTHYTDLLKNTEFDVIYEDNLYDSHGNITKSAYIYKETGKLKILFVRSYEYEQ